MNNPNAVLIEEAQVLLGENLSLGSDEDPRNDVWLLILVFRPIYGRSKVTSTYHLAQISPFIAVHHVEREGGPFQLRHSSSIVLAGRSCDMEETGIWRCWPFPRPGRSISKPSPMAGCVFLGTCRLKNINFIESTTADVTSGRWEERHGD